MNISGINGEIYVNPNGDREFSWMVLDMNSSTGDFLVNYYKIFNMFNDQFYFCVTNFMCITAFMYTIDSF